MHAQDEWSATPVPRSGVAGEQLEVLEVEAGGDDAADQGVRVRREGPLPPSGRDDDLESMTPVEIDAEQLDDARARLGPVTAELECDHTELREPDAFAQRASASAVRRARSSEVRVRPPTRHAHRSGRG